jgi:hypothetical protein
MFQNGVGCFHIRFSFALQGLLAFKGTRHNRLRSCYFRGPAFTNNRRKGKVSLKLCRNKLSFFVRIAIPWNVFTSDVPPGSDVFRRSPLPLGAGAIRLAVS